MYRNILIKVRKFLVFVFIIVAGCLIKIPGIVYAAGFSDAQVIPLNTSIEGNVTNGWGNERNYYKFTLSSAGSVFINFTNPLQSDSKEYWKMYLYNSSYKEIWCVRINGNMSNTDSIMVGLDSGDYYIMVHSANDNWALSTDIYTIKVNYTKSDIWEKEFNEDYVSATSIEPGTKYYGTICGGYDKDFYKFLLPSDGKIMLNFSHPLQADSGKYWEVYIYNSQYNLLCSENIYGNILSTNLPDIGLSSGIYYIKVNSSERYNVKTTDYYNITVNYEKSTYWEKELNEEFITATDMIIGYEYSGTTHSNSDVDYYKFNINNTNLYMIGIATPELGNTDACWEMHLYDSEYQELDKIIVYGNKTYHDMTKKLLSGTYYIKVNNKLSSQIVYMSDYKLKVADTTQEEVQKYCNHDYKSSYIEETYFSKGFTLYSCEKCGKIYKDGYISKKKLDQGYLYTSCYTDKKNMNLYWATITEASGYQIRYCTRKNFKKGVVIRWVDGQSTDKTTINSLKRNKKYYVQVRAYKTERSKTVYGKWSIKRMLKTK